MPFLSAPESSSAWTTSTCPCWLAFKRAVQPCSCTRKAHRKHYLHLNNMHKLLHHTLTHVPYLSLSSLPTLSTSFLAYFIVHWPIQGLSNHHIYCFATYGTENPQHRSVPTIITIILPAPMYSTLLQHLGLQAISPASSLHGSGCCYRLRAAAALGPPRDGR